MNEPKPGPSGPPHTPWKRDVPSPWIDCERCGWRHYPDTGERRGRQLPQICSRCGHALLSARG